jgi:hypothetical protein
MTGGFLTDRENAVVPARGIRPRDTSKNRWRLGEACDPVEEIMCGWPPLCKRSCCAWCRVSLVQRDLPLPNTLERAILALESGECRFRGVWRRLLDRWWGQGHEMFSNNREL